MSVSYILGSIAVMALATMLTRLTPYFALKGYADSRLLEYLGKVLPPMTMVLLVIYCLKDIELVGPFYGMLELLSVLLVVLLHLWKGHALLSILAPTILYTFLITYFVH
jgi:branched-subunit amino acid transport protein AzlD